jgi:hypothetical protein
LHSVERDLAVSGKVHFVVLAGIFLWTVANEQKGQGKVELNLASG